MRVCCANAYIEICRSRRSRTLQWLQLTAFCTDGWLIEDCAGPGASAPAPISVLFLPVRATKACVIPKEAVAGAISIVLIAGERRRNCLSNSSY